MSFKYAGGLPFAWNKVTKQYYFLLGKEQIKKGWKGSNKWSDFGGGRESKEQPIDTASREFYEETMGIFGNQKSIYNLMKKHKDLKVKLQNGNAYIYLLPIVKIFPNDENKKDITNLGTIFHNIVRYFRSCSRDLEGDGFQTIPTCPNGWYEKMEIKWFSVPELYSYLILNTTKKKKKNKKIYIDQDEYVFREEFLEGLYEIFEQFPFLLEQGGGK